MPISSSPVLRRSTFGAIAACLLLNVAIAHARQQQAPAPATQNAAAPANSATAPQSSPDALTRDKVTSIIREDRRIVSDHGIDELTMIPIGGIQQAISIRGRDTRNPILLVVHGGPGSPEMPHAYTFQSQWEDYFTVVEWDQRGTGKTYAANDPAAVAPTITLDRIAADTIELSNYLRTRFHKQKIFLLGHSWGSIVGVTAVQQHPELYYAYIGVGQVVNSRRSEAIGWKFALDAATADHNQQAIHDLESIAPYPGTAPPTMAPLILQRKWLEYYGGLAWHRHGFQFVADTWELSPDYTQTDLDDIDKGTMLSVMQLLPTMLNVDFDHVTDFRCPVFLFTGRHDYSVSHEVAAQWYETLHAPQKELVWFENSAHLPMLEEPGRFLYHLVTDVRPIAVRAGDAAPDDIVLAQPAAKSPRHAGQ